MAATYAFKPSTLATALRTALAANKVLMVKGAPGIGKSDIVRAVAAEMNLAHEPCHDLRLSTMDPTDLSGFPRINDAGRAEYVPPVWAPLEDDPIPEGKAGWLIFLDEVSNATPSMQAAAYKLILDRQVGGRRLHPAVRLVAAGNRIEDNAAAGRLGTALKSRLLHATLEADVDDWVEWAFDNGISDKIIAFLRFRTELLHKFDPKSAEETFPCPRTWHFLNDLLAADPTTIQNPGLMAGTVGEGAATEFKSFVDLFNSLPDFNDILLNPGKTPVPEEPSLLYAVSTLVSRKMNKENLVALIDYVERLPMEFQVLTMTTASRLDKQVNTTRSYITWAKKNANTLFPA